MRCQGRRSIIARIARRHRITRWNALVSVKIPAVYLTPSNLYHIRVTNAQFDRTHSKRVLVNCHLNAAFLLSYVRYGERTALIVFDWSAQAITIAKKVHFLIWQMDGCVCLRFGLQVRLQSGAVNVTIPQMGSCVCVECASAWLCLRASAEAHTQKHTYHQSSIYRLVIIQSRKPVWWNLQIQSSYKQHSRECSNASYATHDWRTCARAYSSSYRHIVSRARILRTANWNHKQPLLRPRKQQHTKRFVHHLLRKTVDCQITQNICMYMRIEYTKHEFVCVYCSPT